MVGAVYRQWSCDGEAGKHGEQEAGVKSVGGFHVVGFDGDDLVLSNLVLLTCLLDLTVSDVVVLAFDMSEFEVEVEDWEV